MILELMYLCEGKMWKSNVKNVFYTISRVGLKFPWGGGY